MKKNLNHQSGWRHDRDQGSVDQGSVYEFDTSFIRALVRHSSDPEAQLWEIYERRQRSLGNLRLLKRKKRRGSLRPNVASE